jgi:predicted Zn-ribbon and HTH transcriptional regulator
MEGSAFGDRLTRYVSATAKARDVPNTPPVIPEGILKSISEKASIEDAPFLHHLARVRVEWLEAEADRLGNTCFEMPPHEVEIRKRQRMPPGTVTVSLHPILAEDEMLFTHTLVHELLHAAGMTEHDKRHAELVNEIAPSPKLSESPLLQDIRNQALDQQEVQDWACGHCGFVWNRTTVRTPSRCPKCARPFK